MHATTVVYSENRIVHIHSIYEQSLWFLNIKVGCVHYYQRGLGGYRRLILKYRPFPVKIPQNTCSSITAYCEEKKEKYDFIHGEGMLKLKSVTTYILFINIE